MLDTLFLSVLNMSITASLVMLVVLLVRLFLKKTPKIFSYAIWAVVLFRLICPFSFETAIGLLPINETPIPQDIVYQAQPQIDTGIPIIDNSVNLILPAPDAGSSVNPLQIWTFIGSHVWIIGIAVMLIFSIIQFVKLKRKLIGATPLRDNIYLADHTSSPFVMGFIKPKIYLPSSMAETEQEFIIAHEQYHIKRFDHITRILGFIALTIHWFNPLVWLAFILSGKDMEMSCDEAVMRKMGTDIRSEYSQSLLHFATGRKLITATPLAFGEGDTKDRVKNVMKYKKPMRWVIALALVSVICVAVGLMSNPKENLQTEDFKEMIVGAELPYLLYANNDYCIMNMWHGGVIVYDFTTQEISDRITFEELERAGFSYPIPMVSENGEIIYFREDSQASKQPYTYSYNLQTRELNEENDDVKDVIHHESIYENQLTQALLSDGLAYGGTMIKFDDTFIVSRIIAGGSLLSDTEIVFLKEDLTQEKTFHLFKQLNNLKPMLMVDEKLYLETGKIEAQITSISSDDFVQNTRFSEKTFELVEGEWLENEYTKNIPKPTVGTVARGWVDTEKKYCHIQLSDINETSSEEYIEILKQNGFKEIKKVSERIKEQNYVSVGTILSNGDVNLSIAYFQNHLNMYINLDE